MDVDLRPPPGIHAPDLARGAGRVRLGVAATCATAIAVHYTVSARAVAAQALHNDLGIQYYLARVTARGAVPLLDFEHGWNTLSWYISAFLYQIAGGNASTWVFLWGRGGFILAGFLALAIAWRAGLRAPWLAGFTAVWIVLTHVPHNKYAVPTAWVAVLLWTDQRLTSGWRRSMRIGLAATVFWAHVELAILLAIGTAMYDLVGRRDGTLGERLVTAAHAPVGVVAGLGSQIAVYAALGLGPTDFLTQAIGAWTVTDFGPLFDYPFLAPFSTRMALFPLAVLVPFVPLLWRHLSDPARLLALCTLALSLIAIRRPGDGHVAAAGTLIAPMLVIGVRDVTDRWDEVVDAVRAAGRRRTIAVAWGAVGVVWYAAGLQAGFRTPSLLAVVALTLVCLTAVVVERVDAYPAASIGAMGAAVLVLLLGTVGHARQEVAADQALVETGILADAVAPALDRCVGDDRSVWVVPSPLTLYDALQIHNPTPIYAFWYNLGAQHDRLRGWMDDGTIPAILQVGSWPESMVPLVEDIEARYVRCAVVTAEGSPRTLTLWSARGD
jgi:hypothetical protein